MSGKNEKIEKIKQIRNNLTYHNFSLGKQLIEEYINMYGKDCYVELEKAKYYHYTSNYKRAMELLINLADSNPKNIGYVLFELGRIYEKQKMYQEAIETYQKIELTNHKSKEYAYFSLGNIYEHLFEHEKSISFFEKAIFPHSTLSEDSKLHIARNYIYLKDYEKASEYLKNTLTHNNPKLACLVNYYNAKIESCLGNYDKYVEMIDDLLNRSPDFNPALAEKVRILFAQKKYDEGRVYLKKIHTVNSNIKEYCGYKILSAEYYEKTNQFVEALKIYQDLLDNQIDNLKAIEVERIIIGIATCYVGIGNVDKAYEYFMKLSDESTVYKNASIFNIISIEIYRGNYDRAYELLQQLEITEENKVDIFDLKLMLSKHIDIDISSDKELSYRERQIANYSKEEAIDHINRGHMINNAPSDEGAFYSETNLGELIDEIKEKLSEDSVIGLNILKKHKLYYENIGVFDGEQLDYLLVVTPLYSNDIITMYPTNKLLKEKMEAKPKQKIIKRESQIEKFNRRYNKK